MERTLNQVLFARDDPLLGHIVIRTNVETSRFISQARAVCIQLRGVSTLKVELMYHTQLVSTPEVQSKDLSAIWPYDQDVPLDISILRSATKEEKSNAFNYVSTLSVTVEPNGYLVHIPVEYTEDETAIVRALQFIDSKGNETVIEKSNNTSDVALIRFLLFVW